MLSMTLTVNLRCLASHFVKRHSFALSSQRNWCSKAVSKEGYKPYEDEETPEEALARETAIENKRNKSNLMPSDYNMQHGAPPHEEVLHDYQESLRYRRRLYGKYGESSNVDPYILWPSKEELSAMKEYEGISQPFTIQQLIQKVREAKEKEIKERIETEARVLKKAARVQPEIAAFEKRCIEREKKVQEVIEKRNKLIERVRKHFGFNIDVKDERFKAMLAEIEQEDRKQAKAAKKAKKQAFLTGSQTGGPKAESEKSQGKEQEEDDDMEKEK